MVSAPAPTLSRQPQVAPLNSATPEAALKAIRATAPERGPYSSNCRGARATIAAYVAEAEPLYGVGGTREGMRPLGETYDLSLWGENIYVVGRSKENPLIAVTLVCRPVQGQHRRLSSIQLNLTPAEPKDVAELLRTMPYDAVLRQEERGGIILRVEDGLKQYSITQGSRSPVSVDVFSDAAEYKRAQRSMASVAGRLHQTLETELRRSYGLPRN